jgi:hypothetical protein
MSYKIKSGGPQTPEGKLVASHNSLKTGVYSKLIVLPGEDESQFLELETQLLQDFAPQDIAERAMIHDLAILTWKRIRLEQLEYRVIKSAISKEVDEADMRYIAHYQIRDGAEWVLGIIDKLDEDIFQMHSSRHLHAQAFLGGPAGEPPLDALKKVSPDLYRRVLELADLYELEDQTHKGIQDAMAPDSHDATEPFVYFALQEIINEAEDIAWAHENLADIKAAMQRVKDDRFVTVMQKQNTSRASDDLSRAFFKTLAELRKHQLWRYQRQVVDITTTVNESRSQIEDGGTKKS